MGIGNPMELNGCECSFLLKAVPQSAIIASKEA